jgi:hypothetical protein
MCSFFDIGCHIQMTIWETWANTSWLTKFLIVGGLVGLIVALCWSFLLVLKKLGGWPAVIAAVAIILGAVLALLPRKPKGHDSEHVSGRDALPSVRVPSRKRGKRVFDSDTGVWKDVE